MPELELSLLGLTFVGLSVGSWGIVWARTSHFAWRVVWGRGLFVCALLFLGASGLVAAFHRAEGLVPLGLSAGLLLVAMLWETPRSALAEYEAAPWPEER